ncbi:MAG TPA: CopG family transcriptional regulator [Candidatus Anaerobutyricum avicola]|nr:CopG family transcriptional regulator [Candidatus Anaerobutyricum avicola]
MDKTDNKLVITPKDDKYVTMTIRTEKKIQEEYNKLSARTNRSRNELINRALKYALDNMVIDDEE